MSVPGARLAATTAFFSMADSAVIPQSRPRRAARPAQRLAQLGGGARDSVTLDLFPDDPTRATLEAMNIDIRQGTLHGFELPDVVRAAVGALNTAGSRTLETKSRRANRAMKSEDATQVNAQLSGLEWDMDEPAHASRAGNCS
jgi:hypothetical protein